MHEFEFFRPRNRILLGISVPLALAGVIVLAKYGEKIGPLALAIALPLMGAGAIIATPVLAELFTDFFIDGLKSLIFPEANFDRIPLRTSQAEALDKAGRFQEALDAYAQLMEEYPDEVKPIIARIRIAVERLHDSAMAEEFYEDGMTRLSSPSLRRTLTEMHDALQSELQAPSLRKRCHTLPPPKAMGEP